MGFIDTIISQLAPYECVSCGQEGSLLCLECAQRLPALPARCYRCRKPSSSSQTCSACGLSSKLRRVSAVTTYDTVAKDLVWQLKFQGAQAAANLMAQQMARTIQTIHADEDSYIVPVPTATTRVRQRGYDQAKLLARQLAKRSGLVYMDCLRRHGQAHQVGSTRQERLTQLQAAFRLKTGYNVDGCAIILIDDVLTTGATLETAASVLQAAAVRQVDAVVFAQA